MDFKKIRNIAFIDGQNLYLGTAEDNWQIDYAKFRTYLHDKYHIEDAYYFFGFGLADQRELYKKIQKSGFIIIFKEHNENLKGKKKGNVDTDIVFEAMKSLIEESFDRIVIVSGDGDYKKVIDYLIRKNRFEKILFPNKKNASSLYKKLGSEYFDYLKNPRLQAKIEYLKRAP